jgi:hypothetical protein
MIVPTGNFLISMSILYMYYHQTLILRLMQKKVVSAQEEDDGGIRLISEGNNDGRIMI